MKLTYKVCCGVDVHKPFSSPQSLPAALCCPSISKSACNDCGDEKGFVNIDATADLVGKFHDDPPVLGRERQGLSHHALN